MMLWQLKSLVVLLWIVALAGTARLVAEEIDTSPLSVQVEKVFVDLEPRIERPIALESPPDKTNRLVVASQLGVLYVFPNDPAVAQASVFMDVSDRVVFKSRENEEGLLGMAFHPEYASNRKFYLYYTTTDAPHTSVISEFQTVKGDPNRADPATERELMRIPQPFWNHNGGTIVFGPDGFLYIGLGDGGAANDPMMNGQNVQTLLGSILRIDVDGRSGRLAYGIPDDNPFATEDRLARPEIWAYGFRNVWRIAFDRKTGLLWAADVGQDLWEEIDIVHRGGNYGWDLREGQHKFGPVGSPPREGLIDPIFEYHHDVGKSITGGTVYRGKLVPSLVGKYLYADYVSGKVWALDYDPQQQRVVGNHLISEKQMPIISFGEDQDGELYFMTDSHTIHRFVEVK